MLRAPAPVITMLTQTARAARRVRRLEGGERLRAQAEAQQEGARAVLRRLRVHVRVEGALPDQPVLIAPNHTSWLDGFLMASVFQTALAARHDVRDWPVVGWVARTMGVVPVYRDRTAATADFVSDVQTRLAEGVHVLAFPEGTTTHGERLLPFKTGMFEAVAGTDYAVLPVYHQVVRANGEAIRTPEALAPFAWAGEGASLVRSARHVLAHAPVEVVVRIGTPLQAAGETRKTLAAKAEAAVSALRAEVLHGG